MNWKLLFTGCVLAACSPLLHASAIFECGAGSGCNGNEYSVFEVSHSGTTYVIQLDINVTSGYTGSTTDYINSVSLKDFISAYSNASLILAPGGVANWNFVSNELNANGCEGGSNQSLCAEATGLGAALFSGNNPVGILSWQFQFDSNADLGDTSHIKYRYVNSEGAKVGSLGSWDIGIQCKDGDCGTVPPSEVPEPLTMSLTGAGLVGIYFVRRKRLAREER